MKRTAPQGIGADGDYVRILGRRSQRHLSLGPGSECWVLINPSATRNCPYRKATVLEYLPGDSTLYVKLMDDEATSVRLPLDVVLEAEECYVYDDAAEMKVLNYPNVLENIRQRFELAGLTRKMIYTYAGWVLFAVNPYQTDNSIYSDYECEQYYRKTITQEKPHPFALASTAFSRLISDQKSQYILISGESGGGKTECSKHVLKYLTWVTRRQRRQRGRASVGGPGDAAETLATLLIDASPLLEFFGNAKTARNVNSSRFGKLFQLCYDPPGEKLLSAYLSTYLLAKSRVVQVPAGEENYHVFHSMMYGLDHTTKDLLYLNQEFTSPFLGDDWSKENIPSYYKPEGPFHFDNLIQTLTEFGIHEFERINILKLLASILHLGNVKFEALEHSTEGGSRILNPETCVIVCKLWGLPLDACEQLESVLTSKQIRDTRSRLTPDQCRNTTFSLCKGLYELLFFYIVQLVRQKLQYAESRYLSNDSNSSKATGTSATGHCIGVLDLFGFENMEPGSRNGFEQLCINYANEQLHFHFMTEVIERELEIYESEGIMVKPKAMFHDLSSLMSQDVLHILLGVRGHHSGVFAILEDVTKLGGNDAHFCRRANQLLMSQGASTLESKKRKNFESSNSSGLLDTQFRIDHFAEPVTYTTDGFSDRNQDYMSDEVRSFLAKSNSGSFLNLILKSDEAPAAKVPGARILFAKVQSQAKSTARSLCGVFVKQMASLMATLDQTSCYFIRCLKPNDTQEAFVFDKQRVLKQLVTGGVGPVLELMKEGYPCRLTYDALWDKFKDYLPEELQKKLTPRDFGDLALSYLHVNPASYSLGTTRVFFRFGILQLIQSVMEDMTEEKMEDFAIQVHKHQMVIKLVRTVCALMVGRKLVTYARRLKHRRCAKEAALAYTLIWLPRRQEKAARTIQCYFLSIPERMEFLRVRKSVRQIQGAYRRHLFRRRAMQRRLELARIHGAKGIMALMIRLQRKRLATRYKAAVKIQALWRGYSCRQSILAQIRAQFAKLILFAWRRYKLRKALRRIFSARKPPPELADWASPIRPPVSPCAASSRGVSPSGWAPVSPTGARSAKRFVQRRASMVYQETRTFWELSAVNPSTEPKQILDEVRRRRRSVFCQIPPPSPSVSAAVAEAVSPIARAAEEAPSPTFGSCYSPDTPRDVAPPNVDSLKRSRRCIESGARYGGSDSSEVVNMFAQVLNSNTLHPHKVSAGRLSVGDLSGPSDTQPTSKLRTMGNRLPCRTTPTEPLTKPIPRDLTTTADSASPEIIHRSEPPSRTSDVKNLIHGSRLSINAWRGEVERQLQGDVPDDDVLSSPPKSLQPSFSCTALSPGWPKREPPSWAEGSFPTSNNEGGGATPLFGSRRPDDAGKFRPDISHTRPDLTRPTRPDLTRLPTRVCPAEPSRVPPAEPSRVPEPEPLKAYQEKENTPRPRQFFCLPRKPIPSTKIPMFPLGCLKAPTARAVSSKIPIKPSPGVPTKIIRVRR